MSEYAESVAKITSTLTEAPELSGLLLPAVFEQWHRAHLLGMQVASVRFDGHELYAPSLERLNFWIEAHGAWRASLLDHFECERVLATVIKRNVVVKVGDAGGGRWAKETTSRQLARKGMILRE